MLKQWLVRVALGRTSVGNALLSGDRPDPSFEANWRRHMRTRLVIMFGFISFWAVVLEARLVFLQVVAHDDYMERARKQQQDVIEPDPGRGDIVDRNGQLLAYTVESYQLIANPSRVEDAAADAQEICAALSDCTAEERAEFPTKLSRTNVRGARASYALLRPARMMSPRAAAGIRALLDTRAKEKKPLIVALVAENLRFYPKMMLASHILGFVGGDGKGAGIEAKYNKVIAGSPGRVLVQVDAGAREIGSRVERAATAGASIELTIDQRLQYIAERELQTAVREHKAAGGSVVILDPFNGEILAMASFPTFNPNAFRFASDDERRNRAIQDLYEPGSTLKIVTASAALNEGLFHPGDLVNTSPGIINIGNRRVKEAKGHNYGVLSFEDVIVKSSNVGAIKIGQRVGSDRMLDYLRRFGFDQALAPDFAGEQRGLLPGARALSDSSLASISFGHEIGVTPMQMAVAASVVANGGSLIEPRVIRAFVRNGRREEIDTKVLRQAISAETAATMTAIMEDVVQRGTAKSAALERYQVAGKTGTAEKVVNGRYSSTDYNVSFVGFVPSRRPAFTILVVIDTPRIGQAYGGTIAAPVFKRIAEAALQQIGVAPTINPAPPIISASIPTPTAAPQDVEIVRVGGRQVMPDLRGKGLREAMRVANKIGIIVSAEGEGIVTEQSPAAGEFADPGTMGMLHLKRVPAVAPDRRGGR